MAESPYNFPMGLRPIHLAHEAADVGPLWRGFWYGLRGYAQPELGNALPRVWVPGRGPIHSATNAASAHPGIGFSETGPAWSFVAASSNRIDFNTWAAEIAATSIGNGECAWLCQFDAMGGVPNDCRILSYADAPSNNDIWIRRYDAFGGFQFYYINTVNIYGTGVLDSTAGVMQRVLAMYDAQRATNRWHSYDSGRLFGEGGGTANRSSPISVEFTLGRNTAGTFKVAQFAAWDRKMTAGEAMRLSADPWGPWRRTRKVFYVPSNPLVTTIRPSADVTDGGWLNQASSNTNLYASVDDDPVDDATYIQSTLTGGTDVCEVALANPGATPPAGTVTLYIRHEAV